MRSRRQRSRGQSKTANGAEGLSRDRNFLVIDLREHHFPPRCLKSNLPAEVPAEPVVLWSQSIAELEVDRFDDDDELMESGLVKITHGHKSKTTVEVRLRIPLRPFWRRLICWPWGSRVAMLGGIGVAIGFFFAWLSQQFPDWVPPGSWGLPMLASLAIAFLGLFIRLCLSWILPIRRIEEKKVWLGGVHRDYLKVLPQFVPSSGMLVRELEVANWKFWPALAIGWLLVTLSLTMSWSMQPDLLGRTVTGAYLIGIAITILHANSVSAHIHRTRKRLDELYLRRLRRRKRQR